jgi:ABC-2 type transport system permease protein
MFTLARNELYRLFISPIAWVIASLTLLILAYLFLTHIDNFTQVQTKIAAIPGAPGVTELIIVPLFGNCATVLLLIAPLVTMRLIAEERRNESLPLLLSAPLHIRDIVIGKYLGAMFFFTSLLLLICLMPLSLTLGANIDMAVVIAGLFGLMLLVSSFSAIGLYLSSLTKHPSIAAMTTFTSLFLLWIIDWAGATANESSQFSLFNWLSLLRHFEPILRGELVSTDIIYYVLVTTLFLILTIRHLDAERVK